jgi:acyl-CoA thioesterase FadM
MAAMSRVEIELPERFLFSTEIPIRVDDLNYGGHLGNDRVLTLAQEARVRWLRSHGLGELAVGGAGLILTDASVTYRAEGHLGMVLKVELAVSEVRHRGFELLYRLSDAAGGREIARVRTGLLCFDYATRKVVSLTPQLRAALAG